MPKYCVSATVTVGTITNVIASDEEEAKAVAEEELCNNLCYGLGFDMTNVSVKEED